jgi:hypothetical protein
MLRQQRKFLIGRCTYVHTYLMIMQELAFISFVNVLVHASAFGVPVLHALYVYMYVSTYV